MSDWRFWDWAGYGALWVVVLIEAVETSVKMSPLLGGLLPNVPEAFGFLPLALLVFATAVLVIRVLKPDAGERRGTVPKELLDAMERLCGDEHEASLRAHHHMAPQDLRTAPTEDEHRLKFQKHIADLREPAKNFGLSRTVAAVNDAVTAFNSNVARQVAWFQFNNVSKVLKEELASRAPSRTRPSLVWGVGAAGVALVIAAVWVRPSTVEWRVTSTQEPLLVAAITGETNKLPFVILPIPEAGGGKIASDLLRIFGQQQWAASLKPGDVEFPATTTGLRITVRPGTDLNDLNASARAVKRVLEKAGFVVTTGVHNGIKDDTFSALVVGGPP